MTAERLPAGLLANETVQWSAGPLIEAARCGGVLEPDQGRPARVIEDQVPDRDGNRKNEPVLLVTIITDWRLAPAEQLARTYHQRWGHETGNAQLKLPCADRQGAAVRIPGPDPGDLGLPANPLIDATR